MTKETYILVDGGLGNQLFQYSFGTAVSELTQDVKVHLDDTMFRLRRKDRSFLLSHLLGGFDVKAAPRWTVPVLYLKKRFAVRLLRSLGFVADPVESFEEATQAILSNRRSYVHGYWQAAALAAQALPRLREVLLSRYGAAVEACCMANDVDLERDAALHIRRGDYLASRHTRMIYYTCTESYYLSALAELKKTSGIRKVQIFSDDIEWCRRVFRGEEYSYVTFAGDLLTEFALLASFRNIVISNSTFSWWAAFCNLHKDKHVIAPEVWQRGLHTRDTQLFVPGWRYVNNVMPYMYKRGIERTFSNAYRRLLPPAVTSFIDIHRSYGGPISAGCIFIHNPRAAGAALSHTVHGRPVLHLSIAELRRFGGRRLNRLPTVAVVREPVSRLISAYRFLSSGGTDLVRADWQPDYDAPSFANFESFVLEWLSNRAGEVHKLDYVLRPQSSIVCMDGQIAVDHLLNFHRLPEGLAELAKHGIAIKIPPKTNQSYGPHIEPSPQCIEAIRRIYSQDYALLESALSKALASRGEPTTSGGTTG